jgi:hypothetical protein
MQRGSVAQECADRKIKKIKRKKKGKLTSLLCHENKLKREKKHADSGLTERPKQLI